MKSRLLLVLMLIGGIATTKAQTAEIPQEYSKSLSFAPVQEEEALMSTGFRNSFSINLPTDDKRLVARVWKTYVSSRFDGRTKYNRKEKEYVSPNVITPVASLPVNLIGKAEKYGGSTQFTLWLDLEGSYIKSAGSPYEAREVELLLEDFAIQIEREKVRLVLEEEEKELRKLENNLRRLESANKRYHREIELSKERIQKMEGNIVDNEQAQVDAHSDIKNQRQRVEAVRNELHKIN